MNEQIAMETLDNCRRSSSAQEHAIEESPAEGQSKSQQQVERPIKESKVVGQSKFHQQIDRATEESSVEDKSEPQQQVDTSEESSVVEQSKSIQQIEHTTEESPVEDEPEPRQQIAMEVVNERSEMLPTGQAESQQRRASSPCDLSPAHSMIGTEVRDIQELKSQVEELIESVFLRWVAVETGGNGQQAPSNEEQEAGKQTPYTKEEEDARRMLAMDAVISCKRIATLSLLSCRKIMQIAMEARDNSRTMPSKERRAHQQHVGMENLHQRVRMPPLGESRAKKQQASQGAVQKQQRNTRVRSQPQPRSKRIPKILLSNPEEQADTKNIAVESEQDCRRASPSEEQADSKNPVEVEVCRNDRPAPSNEEQEPPVGGRNFWALCDDFCNFFDVSCAACCCVLVIVTITVVFFIVLIEQGTKHPMKAMEDATFDENRED